MEPPPGFPKSTPGIAEDTVIARHEGRSDVPDVWKALAVRFDPETLEWRQDGRPNARDGKYFARFVAYIEAGQVRERLDTVVPGEWSLTIEPLPLVATEEAGNEFAFKARLQVLGVVREDVGTGKDYKQASTDSFKRAAVRFGIGHELYDMDQLWVPMDGDGKYAKPLQDPKALYRDRLARTGKREDPRQLPLAAQPAQPRQAPAMDALALKNDLMVRLENMRKANRIGNSPYATAWAYVTTGERTLAELQKVAARLDQMDRERADREYAEQGGADAVPGRLAAERSNERLDDEVQPRIADEQPECPKCGGRMWDNRIGKRNPKAPDFKCKDRGCDGVIWPEKEDRKIPAENVTGPARTTKAKDLKLVPNVSPNTIDKLRAEDEEADEIPF